jgi:hypothetical protein
LRNERALLAPRALRCLLAPSVVRSLRGAELT